MDTITHVHLTAHNETQFDTLINAVLQGHVLAPMAQTFGMDPDPLIEVKEGQYRKCATGNVTYLGERHTIYARKDGKVVWGQEFMYQATYDLNYGWGDEGTVDFLTAVTYAVWLQGYEPVYVAWGRPAPRDCTRFRDSLDPQKAKNIPDELLTTEDQGQMKHTNHDYLKDAKVAHALVAKQRRTIENAKSLQGINRSMTHFIRKHNLGKAPQFRDQKSALIYLDGIN